LSATSSETVICWALQTLSDDGWRHVRGTNFGDRSTAEAMLKNHREWIARNEKLGPIARDEIAPMRLVKRTCVMTEIVEVIEP